MDEDIFLTEGSNKDLRTETPGNLDDMLDDGQQLINLRQYYHLIPYLVIFAIVVALVRGAVPKRDRRGCTFVVFIAFVIIYFFNRCVHL